ncbi:glycerol-3-phosphate 1-O-acyltransferase PlsY [Alcaligenaceae bacterium]|nr:glycerol-3-phosphate 1-O-acyltransferase PlsY [Alcaligenaceae bacterium]
MTFAVIIALALIVASYLIGSVSFAVLVSRGMGLQDPRSFGSKNPGATNVLRSGNKTAAVLTLIGDAAKGSVAVLGTAWIAHYMGMSSAIVAASAIAVFLGHVFPVFLGFKGGKGVATALGVLLALSPWLGVATLLTWVIVAYATRYSSLAAIASAIFAPLYYLLGAGVAWPMNKSFAIAIVVISVLLLFRHQANISRLLTGKETRIGSKKGKS